MKGTTDMMRKLTAEDRCDRCGAQARHTANKEGFAELLFCNHHHREFDDALWNQGFTVLSDLTDLAPTPVAAYTE